MRRRYLRNMCFSVWTGEDGKSQSKQIFEWIKGLLESKATVTDVDELDCGNCKARRNKTRRSKTRHNKTSRNKTRHSKTRRNKTRRNKTRKNKRR